MANSARLSRHRTTLGVAGAGVAIAALLSACTTVGGNAAAAGSRETAECTATTNAAIAELTSGATESKDPTGRPGVSATTLVLTDAERAEIKKMAPTIAIFMHRLDDDSAKGGVAGMMAAIEDYGFKLITTSVADSDVSKQVADLETVAVQAPDAAVGLPLDASATAAAWRVLRDAGTELVFIDYTPEGFEPGTDYISVVSNDDRSNGKIDAYLLARGLGCAGEVGLIPYVDHAWFSNYERYLGVKEVLAEFPDITIVQETEIAGPDFAGDGEKTASAMLTKYPNLAGIWSFWATPGSGVVQAVKQSGRTDVVTTTNDLTEPAGLDILEGDVIYGLASGQYYQAGYAEVTAAALGLLGNEVPPYVVLPAYAVDKSNVLQAWRDIFASEPSQALVDAAK